MAIRTDMHTHRQGHPTIPSHYEEWLLRQDRMKRRALAASSLLPRPDIPVWKRSDEIEDFLCHIRGLPED